MAWSGMLLLLSTVGGPIATAGVPPPSRPNTNRSAAAVARPYATSRIHRMGGIRLGVTNYGMIGGYGAATDTCLEKPWAPAFEFPAGSGLDYLWGGALWIGAVRGRDTLVSVGHDGWYATQELWAEPFPQGAIRERTTRWILEQPPGSPCPDVYYSADAISEQDFLAVYYDTLTSPQIVLDDPIDGRPHIPLGIKVEQRSFAWAFMQAQGFVIFEFDITNIGADALSDVYVGLYVDADVAHMSATENNYGMEDDISGFLHAIPARVGHGYLDTVNVAWIADNDGDPTGGQFDRRSPTGAAGVRVLRSPNPDLKCSFNWWVSHTDVAKDWGPNKRQSEVTFVLGNLGTPAGDRAKYQMMANGEFDYDQVESALDHQARGWLPPVTNPALAADLADGFDTRFLLGFGPFQVPPDTTLPLTVAFIGARDFHTEPRNYSNYFNPDDPAPYYEHLDFENLGNLARWAGWVYDMPGFDTDGDGYRGKFRVIEGDTSFYQGDGIPDYRNPPAPPAPRLSYDTRQGIIMLRWNGEEAETTRDPFSLLPDFEGYRVYMSRTGRADEFQLLAQRDRINYARHEWNAGARRWLVREPPLTLDSLKTLYDDLTDSLYGYPLHPDSFKVSRVEDALFERVVNERDPRKLDSNYYYFTPYEANEMVDDLALARAAAEGMLISRVIRKTSPEAPSDSIAYRDDGSAYRPFYEYEYTLNELQLAEPVILTATTFDFGNPGIGLSPFESSPVSNAKEIWPVSSSQVVRSERPKAGVYPNPYRAADAYFDAGWENRRGLEPDRERARQVTFYDVPETCTVCIWSLDGDLVRKLEHRVDPSRSDATIVVWNLITRNTQAVKTGIYIWSVESRYGTDVGKLVIIK